MDDHTILAIIMGVQVAAVVIFGYYMQRSFQDMHRGFEKMLKTELTVATLVIQETEKVSTLVTKGGA